MILEHVCAVLERQNEVAGSFAAYVFGSVLAGGSSWADVDVLLVAKVPADLDRLRQAHGARCMSLRSAEPLGLVRKTIASNGS